MRLLLFNLADPGDIPTTDSDKAFAVWIPPKIFQTDEAAKSLSAGPVSLVSAMFRPSSSNAKKPAVDREKLLNNFLGVNV